MPKKIISYFVLISVLINGALILSAFSSNKHFSPYLKPKNTYDFGEGKDGQSWFIMNDDVMGGYSKGRKQLTENSMVFNGNISLKNNGGYTFVRCSFGSVALGNAKQLTIRYRSSSQTMGLNFNDSKVWYKPYYKLLLEDTANEWKVVTLNLTEAVEYQRGKPTKATMPISLVSRVRRLGFSNVDLKEGPFSFEVDYMKFE